MIGQPKTHTLDNIVISGVAHEGLSINTRDGRRADLAVVDDAGNILAVGEAVTREVYGMSVAVYRQFLCGQGHLRVHGSPTDTAKASH